MAQCRVTHQHRFSTESRLWRIGPKQKRSTVCCCYCKFKQLQLPQHKQAARIMLQQLILRLQQQACQRLGTGGSCTVSTHSLIPTLAAAACGNSSSCCSSIWTASTCQQQQQQHDAQPQQPHLQQLLPGQRQQPQTSSAGARLFSSSAAAADAALLSVKLPPPLPCVLNTSKPSKQRLGSANTIKYPYPLPPTYR